MKEIILSRGKKALVDDSDFIELSKFKWTYSTVGYAVRNDRGVIIYMHRVIMNPVKGMVVDHIDRNTLNNQRYNLRVGTRMQNSRNRVKPHKQLTSKYKGVHFDKTRKKWKAEITVNYKNKYLGRFDKEMDAVKAYDLASVKYHLDFSRTNI